MRVLIVVVVVIVALAPTGMYFDYARVTPDSLEWMAVVEPLEYQWFYGRDVGDSVEWLPVTDRIPSSAPFGMPIPYSIPAGWFEIQPGQWQVCGYRFYNIPWLIDCELAEYTGG